MSEFTPGIGDGWQGLGGLDDPIPPSEMGTIHPLHVERAVWVVAITLKAKLDPGSTVTYYLSRHYFDAGGLYAGSPVIYPLLAGEAEDLAIQRGVGREIAVLYEPEVAIYGNMAMDDYGRSFLDLLQNYEIHEANVDVFCYFAPFYGLATSTAANLMQANMKVRTFNSENDVLSLGCRQVLFKDKEISKRLELETFPSMVEESDQEYGSIVFGRNVVVNTPFIVTSTPRESEIFLGWVATGHALKAFNQLYARNTENPSDAEWVPIQIDNYGVIAHGHNFNIGYGDTVNTVSDSWCHVFSPSPGNNKILFGIYLPLLRQGSEPGSDDGIIECFLYRAPSYSNLGVWEGERLLREVKFDNPNNAALRVAMGYIFPALVATENENYLLEVRWSNPASTDYYALTLKTISPVSGKNEQSKDNLIRGSGWVAEAGTNVGMSLLAFQQSVFGGFDSSEGAAPLLYGRYRFACTAAAPNISPAEYTPNSDGKMHYGLELKASIDGIQDDASGTYTGVAFGNIERPSDIIRFLLLEDEIGINHGSGNVDTTSLSNARTLQAAKGFAMSFALDAQTFATSVILEILRYSMTAMWLMRSGKIGLHFWQYRSDADETIHLQKWKDELALIAIADTTDDEVLNDISIPFGLNKLNPIRDREVTRRLGGTSSYDALAYVSETGSSSGDAVRIAKAAASVTKYGRRTVREPAVVYNADSTAPETLLRYWLDRWSEKQKRAAIRVPIIEFHQRELFDSIKLSHKHLPSKIGTAHRIRWHDGGEEVTWYRGGVPTKWSADGSILGQVIETRMQGDDVVLTIETTSPF